MGIDARTEFTTGTEGESKSEGLRERGGKFKSRNKVAALVAMIDSILPRLVAILLCLVVEGSAAAGPEVMVRPLDPAALAVTVGPGRVKLADGSEVSVPETRLSFSAPETRHVSVSGKTPRDHAEFYDAWDPWPPAKPGQAPNTFNLSPKQDEEGTRILGHLYRAFLANSVVVTKADGSKTFKAGQDYLYNPDWGQIANLHGGLGPPNESEIRATADYTTQRLDLIQVDATGKPTVKKGISAMVCPALPQADAGCTALAGIYLAPWKAAANPYFNGQAPAPAETEYAVTQHEIFPIAPTPAIQPVNAQGVSKSLKKLHDGEELKIAFLGASITVGAETPHWWADLWTDKNLGFASRVVIGLRKAFPKATVTPIAAFQGGTDTRYGLELIDQTVIPAQADLLLIDFGANDAAGPVGKGPGNPPEKFKEDLRTIIQKARAAQIEVMIVAGEAPYPWQKSGVFARWPAYRQAMLDLAREESVALADVSAEIANLASRGIPPSSQVHNCINHPGLLGHQVYAEVILRFFRETNESEPVVPGSDHVGEARRGQLAQPTIIPGHWAWEKPPLPPLRSILEQAVANPRIYGLYTWSNEYLKLRESIGKVGWQSFRCGGPLDDQAMQAFAEDDVEVLRSHSLKPPHMLDATAEQDAAFIRRYTESITSLLTRYGPGGSFFREHPEVPNRPLRYLEIWNEPNFQYLIPPDKRPLAELETSRESLYSKLLVAAYGAAKACSKEVAVVGFGAGGSGAGDMRFIQNVHKADAAVAASYDILSTHPYVEPVPPETYSVRSWGQYSVASSLATIRRTLADYKKSDTPIWYTEVGWPVSQKEGGFYATTGTQVSPELQAAYVCRLYAYAQRLGVSRVHIMFASDTDNFNGGFFLKDGTWRPSAHAVAVMRKLMPAPRLVDVLSDGEEGYFAFRFDPGTTPKSPPLLMLWNVAGPKIVNVPVGKSPLKLIDMLGHATEVTPVDGTIRVEVGPLPIYLRAGAEL